MNYGGSIKRDPDRGTWTLVVDVEGLGGQRRQVKRRGFATKREAQSARLEIIDDSRNGLFRADGKLTANAYLREWMDGLASSGRRASTVTRYRGLIERHALPQLGEVHLLDVTPIHLDVMYRTMHAAGLSARSVRFLHAVLHRAFADAERKHIIARNPRPAPHHRVRRRRAHRNSPSGPPGSWRAFSRRSMGIPTGRSSGCRR